MTKLERSAMAFLTKVLLRELPKDDASVIGNRRWRVVHIGQSDNDRAFLANKISWQHFDFEDETTKRKFWTEQPLKNKNEGIIKNDDRAYNDIRITQINTNELKVEDSDAKYDIEMTSYDDVEMYSHKSGRTFKFKVTN